MADGRYVLRDGGKERVLVLETLGAPAPPRRRRRRPRASEAGELPESLPLARVTAVRAFAPFDGPAQATGWLEETVASEAAVDAVVGEAFDAINRALHTHSVASGDPCVQVLAPGRATAARLGFGSGEQVAEGEFSAARQVRVRTATGSRRRQRTEELRPQERLAAVLGGREQLDACETLVLRARTDLDAGREREAVLQLRVGLEALLVELRGAFSDPGHEEDVTALTARRNEVGELASQALRGDLNPTQLNTLRELLATCERVLRRRRILQG